MTLRFRAGLPSFRGDELFAVVLRALTESAFGLFFRIVDFSVQKNHLHLLVEASDTRSLTTGMKSFVSRLSKAVNAHLRRRGPVMADRYHLHVIDSPREARAAYVYLFGNARKHAREAGILIPADWVDPRSSGGWFDGWADAPPNALRNDPKPVATARTWLLRVGWRRHGLLSVREEPRIGAKKPMAASPTSAAPRYSDRRRRGEAY